MEALFCINCGEKLVKDACFCMKCGTRVTRPEGAEEEKVLPADSIPVMAEPEMPVMEPEMPVVEPEVQENEPVPLEETVMLPRTHVAQAEPPVVQPEIPVTPVEIPAAPVQKSEKKKEKRPAKARRGVGRTLLAIFLCVLMFVLSTVTVVLVGTHRLTSENGVKALVSDAVGELDSIPASLFTKKAAEDDTIIDFIVAFAQEKGAKFKTRDVEELINAPAFADALSAEVYAYLTDIRNSSKDAVLSARDIRELLKDNKDLIEDTIGIKMSDQARKKAADFAEDSGALEYTDAKLLKEKVPAAYYGVQYGLSIWVLCILGGLLLLLVILLAATNRWGFIRTTGDLGITLTVSSALIALPSAAGFLFAENLLGGLPVGELICVAVRHLATNLLLTSACALGAGVLLILISAIVKKIAAKRLAKVAV